MSAASYRELEVWAKAMDVADATYALVRYFPKQEEYRITSQLVRAAVSVPANIAEGHARGTRKDYAHFISIARGSVAELETLLLLAARARFADEALILALLEEAERVARMLNRLHARLKQAPNP